MSSAPVLVSYSESSWTATGSPKTVSISFQPGDVIVVIAGTESTQPSHTGTPTATGLTFTQIQLNFAASSCESAVSTAVAAASGSGVTLSVAWSDGAAGPHWGIGVWVWRNSPGVGVSVQQNTSTTTKALVPTSSYSAVCWGAFDFAAATAVSLSPTPTNQRQAVKDGVLYSIYVGDITNGNKVPTTSYGVTGSGTGPFSIVAVEILGNTNNYRPNPVLAPAPFKPRRAR